MDSIGVPAGHRRRRSTLTLGTGNDPFTNTAANGGHARGNSKSSKGNSRAQSNTRAEPGEAKISEENDAADFAADAGKAEETDEDSALSDEDLHDDEETGLTRKDRRRKRAKRRRNTRLDNRVIRDKITDEERKEADQNMAKTLATNAILIGLWYLFSLSISLYNKWMFDSERLDFPFPLFTTSMHMLVQFTLATLVLYFVPSLRPNNAPHSSDSGRSRHESEPDRPTMTKLFYLTRIGPCGAATGLDIGLGNTSLKFITLSFYTMCKSSSLAFVLLFAFFFRLETPTWKLVAIIATMTLGVVMMVAGEVEFQLGGFVLVISAAFFSGFRWGLTQILLLRNPATSNPFSSIFFLAPVMFVTLLIIAIPVEGFTPLLENLGELMEAWGPIRTPLLLLFPGTIAFLMTASEFALLQRTSVVTLSIAGIFKEVVTISVAALVFDDKLTPINVSGLVITIGAIGAYNWIKLTKMRNEAQLDVHNHQAQSSGSDGEDEDNTLLQHDQRRPSVDDEEHHMDESLVTVDGDIVPSAPKPQNARAEHSD